MKKLLLYLVAPLTLMISACGGGEGAETNPNEGLKEISFAILDDSLSIMIPDTIKGNIEIKPQEWGPTEIKVGNHFYISIEQREGDIALQKSDIESDFVFKFSRFSVDEPNLIAWEAANADMGKNYFQFYLIHTLGDLPYEIKSVLDGENPYTEGDVKAMIDAAKSLKPKTGSGSGEDNHS